MSEKSTFHETKEVVSRLKEPLKIKAVAVKLASEKGHMIEITANLGWDQIDEVEKDMTDMINAWIRLIEGPMKSKYLGMKEKD
jgi:hypothetical protein